MPDVLATIDNVAALNGGPLKINGRDYIAIRREDWEALLACRGTPEQVLARMGVLNEGPADSGPRLSRADADRQLSSLSAFCGI